MVQGFRAYRFRAATCFQQPRAKEPTVISETLLGNKPTVTEGPNTKPQVLGPTSCLDPPPTLYETLLDASRKIL